MPDRFPDFPPKRPSVVDRVLDLPWFWILIAPAALVGCVTVVMAITGASLLVVLLFLVASLTLPWVGAVILALLGLDGTRPLDDPTDPAELFSGSGHDGDDDSDGGDDWDL